MKTFLIIVTTVVVVLALCLALLNAHQVGVNYIIGHATLPLSVLLIIVFVCGWALGYGMRLRPVKTKKQNGR